MVQQLEFDIKVCYLWYRRQCQCNSKEQLHWSVNANFPNRHEIKTWCNSVVLFYLYRRQNIVITQPIDKKYDYLNGY